MCQQWFSVLGQTSDVVGFLLIVTEWHHMFVRDVYMRQKRIERDYEKRAAGLLSEAKRKTYTQYELFGF
jgi:hypothetical protein